MVVIIDYKVGNLKSVLNACERIGIDAVVSGDPETIRKANAIILPGVGAFPAAMENLEKSGLIPVLNERKEAGINIIGICLGMQILFEKGLEVREVEGLGYLKGNVSVIPTDEKLPHMGWNDLIFNREHPLLSKISEGDDVYFVHSFMADFVPDEVIAYTEYGGVKIPAIVGKDNVLGCQFHPEKSGVIGQKILMAWKEMAGC